jgi:hypothetical protein
MNRSTRTRVRLATFLAAPVAACGIFTGAFLLGSSQSQNLADFGANETAEIGQEHARSAGVHHEHNGGYEHSSRLGSAAGEAAV